MEEKHFEIVKKIINKHLEAKENKAFIFGSRANETNLKYSDLDIAIEGKKIPASKYFEILSELEESMLPFRVDLVPFYEVSEKFRKIAKKKIIPINFDNEDKGTPK